MSPVSDVHFGYKLLKMVLWIMCTGLGLSLIAPTSLAQSEEDLIDTGSGFIAEESMVKTEESNIYPSNLNHCSLKFFTPGPSALCRSTDEASVSQEDLAYLKELFQDTRRIIQSLQYTINSETGQFSYQDAILEAITGIGEDNQEFYRNLHKVTDKFHTEMEDSNPDISEEKKKLKKDFLEMEYLLKITSHLAEQIDTASQDLDMVLTQHLEKSMLLAHRNTVKP
ncbi:uncharacterized protein LOC115465145 [Microcaecilia unicolor]|uniref:Uncharacterized protein LOC115465145 n=1 Tax=Microcaecilia unicolor TaxID=1415580 RepID=A0A6P7XM34_9AMPH|nr:uncharacterized protein LOC115465145 [Microcaecilia unicolor]